MQERDDNLRVISDHPLLLINSMSQTTDDGATSPGLALRAESQTIGKRGVYLMVVRNGIMSLGSAIGDINSVVMNQRTGCFQVQEGPAGVNERTKAEVSNAVATVIEQVFSLAWDCRIDLQEAEKIKCAVDREVYGFGGSGTSPEKPLAEAMDVVGRSASGEITKRLLSNEEDTEMLSNHPTESGDSVLGKTKNWIWNVVNRSIDLLTKHGWDHLESPGNLCLEASNSHGGLCCIFCHAGDGREYITREEFGRTAVKLVKILTFSARLANRYACLAEALRKIGKEKERIVVGKKRQAAPNPYGGKQSAAKKQNQSKAL